VIESLLLGLLTLSLGACVGALLARAPDIRERLTFTVDAWRARRTCNCYARDLAAVERKNAPAQELGAQR